MRKLFFIFLMLCAVVSNAQIKLNKEQEAVKKTVIGFYKWYKSDGEKLNKFILYKGKTQKNKPPYVVDWKEAEKYFTYIRKNVPYLGEDFIKSEKEFLNERQKEFDEDPYGDVLFGFNYDRLINNAQHNETTDNITAKILGKESYWTINIDGAKAVIEVHPYSHDPSNILITLGKEKGIWKISKCVERSPAVIPD